MAGIPLPEPVRNQRPREPLAKNVRQRQPVPAQQGLPSVSGLFLLSAHLGLDAAGHGLYRFEALLSLSPIGPVGI